MADRELINPRVDEVEPDPEQPRKEFAQDSLLGLAKTMEAGQLQPILVRREGTKFIIVDGERRWRAAKLAGLATIQAIVVPTPAGAGARLLQQLIANLQREDPSPLETARAIDRVMKETGLPAAKVALALGMSPATVSRTLALLSLPEAVQKQVEAGDVSASSAYQIARAGDAASQQALAEQVVGGGLTRDGVAGKVKGRKASPACVTVKLSGGRAVTVRGPGLASLDQLIEYLSELLTRARQARPRGVALGTFVALLSDEARAAGGPKKEQPGAATGGASC